METLFILIISIVVRSCASSGNGLFYLAFWKENEIKLINSRSPINTDGVNWTTRIYYNDSFYSTGWDILEVVTNPELPDEDQAYQAGWTEGLLTHKQIYNYWYNNELSMCNEIPPKLCEKADEYLDKNRKWIKSIIDTRADDPYWHQVKLYYRQLDGIYDGYMNATKDAARNLTYDDILKINYITDFSSVLETLGYKSTGKKLFRRGHCSALIKILPGFADVYVGHATWVPYQFMNRIIKRYKFAYHMSDKSNELVPGQQLSFSSYPGVISSIDDFYIINSGLVATETSLFNFNHEINKHNKPYGQVLEPVRSFVANHLANNTESWSRYFSIMNSGTYNNQWMIIDLKKFRPGFEPTEGFLRVLEQMPGHIESHDQTEHVKAHSYWASFNTPFYKNIFYLSKYNKKEQKYGPFFSFENNPRRKIFEREQKRVVDLDSMLSVMRYNNYKTDPFSVYANTTTPNACLAIASRCDLVPLNKSDTILFIKFQLLGAIDAKIGSHSMFMKGTMVAISGPTQSGGALPPFRWSTAQNKSVPHVGQPDLWDFDPILTSWVQS